MDYFAIAGWGAFAAWLSQSRHASCRRWACVVGLLGQPYGFYVAWQGAQWGLASVCVLYSLAWLKGFWVHWLASEPAGTLGTVQLTPGRGS